MQPRCNQATKGRGFSGAMGRLVQTWTGARADSPLWTMVHDDKVKVGRSGPWERGQG